MIQQFSRLALSSQDYLFSQISDSQIPSQFHNTPEIEKLDCIVIQNFKSFDKKYVGPFLNFTCIIGPNGSGKSNILDALMFCFCSQNSRQVLLDVRELINRQGKQSFKELSKRHKICSVQATFILKNGSKFVISRSLDAEGKQQYLANFKNVTKKMYQNILIRKGINSNTPNYAIWQGEIDRLILKSPLQLTNLLQNLSGSIYLKQQYDETRAKLNQIQILMQEKNRKINKFKLDKKNMKAIKHTNEQYTKYDNQYQEVMKKIYYLQVLMKERSIEELVEEAKKVSEEEKKKIGEINELKANAQKDFAKKNELQNEMNQVMAELAESYAQLKNVGNPANVLKIQRFKQAEQELKKKTQQMKYFEERKRTLQSNIPQIPPTPLVEQYLKLYEQWQSQNSSLHRQISKKKNQLLYIEGVIQSKADLMNELQSKKMKHAEKKKEKQATIKGLKQDLQALKQSIKMMEEQSQEVNSHIEKAKVQFQKKNQSYEQLCANLDDLQNMIAEQAQDQKQGEMLKNLASIDGFHGVLHQKIKSNSGKYDICFSIIFSVVGKYLLCQTQQCSRKIGNRLKQIRTMKNVIILNNIGERRTNDIRKALGKDGVMGIDIVDFDQETKGLKDYLNVFLYGKVVCENISVAYRILKKNIQGVKQIYTLDGNVIKKDGSISTHGNPDSIKKLHKFSNNKSTIYQEISKLSKQKIKIETQLKNLRLKFDENQLMKRRSQIEQMNRKKELLILKLKEAQGIEERQPTIPQSVLNQMKDLQRQRDKLNKALVQLEKMIGSSKIFDKFIQKNKIDNLQAFRNANNFEHAEREMKKKYEINKQIANIDNALQKMQKQADRKSQQVKALQREVENIPQMGDKNKIQKNIADKEKQLIEIRNKLSKLTNINRSQVTFHTTLPALQGKLNYAKQKIAKDLQDLSYQLGVQYKYPIDYQQIAEVLGLPRKITDRAIQSLEQSLQQQRTKIQKQLDKHNTINLLINAQDDQQKIEKEMNSTIDEIEQIIKERKKITEKLQTLRQNRAIVLLHFVEEVRQYLNKFYEILTRQEDGTYGKVVLDVDKQVPFEKGIYFQPTPPTKRNVIDLDQLSGGQKSIASLALQYSLSLATKSPLLILDETDAYLDLGNVNRFLNLINYTIKYNKIQMIVVTHKNGIFMNSQSLVGVSRPKQLNLSQVYSLKFDENEN